MSSDGQAPEGWGPGAGIRIRVHRGMSWPHLRRLIESRGREVWLIGHGAWSRRLIDHALNLYEPDEVLGHFESEGLYTAILKPATRS